MTASTSSPSRTHAEHAHALDRLTASLVAAVEAGEFIPCSGPGGVLFVSEKADERAEAVVECDGCPVFAACARVGQFEPFGVWGGADRTPAKTPKPIIAPAPKPKPSPTPRKRPAKAYPPRTCSGCSASYVPAAPHQTFCRQACRTRVRSAERRRRAREAQAP